MLSAGYSFVGPDLGTSCYSFVGPDLGTSCLQSYQQTTLVGKEISMPVVYSLEIDSLKNLIRTIITMTLEGCLHLIKSSKSYLFLINIFTMINLGGSRYRAVRLSCVSLMIASMLGKTAVKRHF